MGISEEARGQCGSRVKFIDERLDNAMHRLTKLMRDLMKTNDAPAEAYRRFGLE